MKGNSKLRWVIAFGVGLVLLAILLLLSGIEQDPAAAGGLLSLSLRSNLSADYEAVGDGGLLGSLQLSVFREALIDRGLSPEDADATVQALEEQLLTQVPTATARDFEGQLPFTATSTNTPTSTPTPIPTSTPTASKTPVPTRTPTRTPVPPTNPPATPKPSKTPSGDTQKPQIPGPGTLTPPPGSVSVCTIAIDGLHVTDPAPSSGMKRVRLKYYDPTMGSYRYSSPLTLTSGGMSGGAWDGFYAGSITVGGVTAGESRELFVIAEDNSGNSQYISLGWYDFTVDCP